MIRGRELPSAAGRWCAPGADQLPNHPAGAAPISDARSAFSPITCFVTLGATYLRTASARKSAKPLIALVGAQGLEPWTR
jgi:hypothetical protein